MRTFVALLVLCISASAATAQGIRGNVTDAATGQPLAGIYVQVFSPDGVRTAATLTDSSGTYRFQVTPLTWTLRFERFGYESVTKETTVVERTWSQLSVALNARAFVLPPLEVASKGRCGNPGEGAGAVHDLWIEVRKSLEAVDWSFKHANQGHYLTEVTVVDLEPNLTPRRSTATSSRVRVSSAVPFEVIEAESAAVRGFANIYSDSSVWYGPDAGVLLSPAFLDTHCFSITRSANRVGLSFWPASAKPKVIDIRGVLWVDPLTAALLATDFTYSTSDPRVPVDSAKGRIEFELNAVGRWIIGRWELRVPHLRFDDHSPENFRIVGYRRTTGVVLEGLNSISRLDTTTSTISGRVSDLDGAPIAGALIRVLDTPYSTRTSPTGTYTLRGIPPGVYTITFLYPQAPTAVPLTPNRKRIELHGTENLSVDLTYDRRNDDDSDL